MNDKAMLKFSYGLYILTSKQGDKNNGCIINTAMQASLKPNNICVCVDKSNYTHDLIIQTQKFNLSVISENADFDLIKHFGFQSGKNVDKFENFNCFDVSDNGIAYITKGTNAYISVKVNKVLNLGSHSMFVGEATDMDILNNDPSVTYQYYFDHIKPKDDHTENKNKKTVWKCRICGYEYLGEEIPKDYICPLCKHPASDFEKI